MHTMNQSTGIIVINSKLFPHTLSTVAPPHQSGPNPDTICGQTPFTHSHYNTLLTDSLPPEFLIN